MQVENGASVDTIKLVLDEEPVGPVKYADIATPVVKSHWGGEPFVPAVGTATPDIDGSMFKATAGRVDPDAATDEIIADVLKQLSGGGDFRKTSKTDEREPEDHADDEPSEAVEFSDAFTEFCSRRAAA
jgi:hypothetical protein